MITVFLSYSHRDEELRAELEIHLAMLQREGLISVWHDHRIPAGTNIDNAVSTHLEEAQLVLLLVSPYFLASSYCYEREMARAIERHQSGEARVIPIILDPCEWQRSPFGGLRATPPEGRPITKFPNPHDAYLAVAADIRQAITGWVGPSSATPTPCVPAATAEPSPPTRPRSSNLRLKRQFTEFDKAHFIDETFNYLANFFDVSLHELEQRNRDVQGQYRRIDANQFISTLYRFGQKMAGCRIWIGASHTRGIMYSASDDPSDGGFNECLTPTDDGQMLMLEPMTGLLAVGQGHQPMSQQGAAEHLWAAFISPLQ